MVEYHHPQNIDIIINQENMNIFQSEEIMFHKGKQILLKSSQILNIYKFLSVYMFKQIIKAEYNELYTLL